MIEVDVGGTLAGSYGRQYREQKNETGSLQFSVLNDDVPGLAVVAAKVVLTHTPDVGSGTSKFMGRIGSFSDANLAIAEESAQATTIAVPGVLATLADGVVYPKAPLGSQGDPTDTRYFNFASADYTGWLSWPAATELLKWRDGDHFPRNWPDPDAWFIWGPDQAPFGNSYLKTSFTLDEDDDCILYLTADDNWIAYVDGVELGHGEKYFGLADTNQFPVFLKAGDHVVALVGINIYPANAHIIVALYRQGPYVNQLVVHSDSTWNVLSFPAVPPGMTPGQIFGILMDEALARGGLTVGGTAWTRDFGDVNDSNGNPWRQQVELTCTVGESLLDVARKMAETWVDFRAVVVDGAPVLQMVNKGGFNTSPDINLVAGIHFATLTFTGEPPGRAVVLVKDALGFYSEVDSTVAGDRREGLLAAGSAPSAQSAAQAAAGAVIATSPGPVTVTAAIEAIAGAIPFVDFHVGDLITMPNRLGVPTLTEVLALTAIDIIDADDGGDFTAYVVEGQQNAVSTGSVVIIDPTPAPPTAPPSSILWNLD